ncbi:MAG: flagellar filament capping protein FliD [Pseudomonadota bacterium]|nr:flagellar filament capping protein FliD [Pseudomonadota bacterium]
MAITPALSSPGIGSGLDVNGIVQKLMAVEQQPLRQMDKQQAIDQARITAYGSLKSGLSTLQSALQGLSTADNFNTLDASTSDGATVTASVSGKPALGSYGVVVSQLAQAQKLASGGFTNSTDPVGTGTLTFELGSFDGTAFTPGSAGSKTVTIAAGQNSLAGIRDAVNVAGVGVTATIVNDGSAAGNRLVFTANNSGAVNSLRIIASDSDGNSTDAMGLSQLAFDPAAIAGAGRNLTEKVLAQDALLSIDGIDVKSSSNTVRGAIDGVTLNLVKTNANPATVSVVGKTSEVDAKVAAFVKAYNDLNSTLTSLTKYDSTKKEASVLTGDGTVRTVQNQLRTLLGGRLGSGTLSTLSQVGVTFQADGTLALSTTKLDALLGSNASAVTQLFAAVGSASDPLTKVIGFSGRTTPGTYALDVSNVASHGALTGAAPASLAITSGVNDLLQVVLDGTSSTVRLAAGTYADADALAAEIQSKVNGASEFVTLSASVKATASGGAITLTSNRFGSTSSVSASGSAVADVFGANPVATPGVDASATLGGTVLSGQGQILLGPTGTAVEGLQLELAGGATGARGAVSYETGFAYRMSTLLKQLVDTDGPLAARTSGLQHEIKDIDKRREALNVHLGLVEANYRAQFNALDTLLSGLSAQSASLQQQLASLPKITG